jgi:hypothetical protein
LASVKDGKKDECADCRIYNVANHQQFKEETSCSNYAGLR